MVLMGKSIISMAIFNSYFDITRGYPLGMKVPSAGRLRFQACERLLDCLTVRFPFVEFIDSGFPGWKKMGIPPNTHFDRANDCKTNHRL